MGPLTQTVKSIVSETHIYQSKQWDLTQTVNLLFLKPIFIVNNGTSHTTVKSIVSETHIYQSKQWDLTQTVKSIV